MAGTSKIAACAGSAAALGGLGGICGTGIRDMEFGRKSLKSAGNLRALPDRVGGGTNDGSGSGISGKF